MSTSHDWGRKLIEAGEFLLSRREVEIGKIPKTCGWFFSEKEAFLGLVRATLPGKKETDNHYVNFYPRGTNIELLVNRDVVCRRINPEWECEPLLTAAESAELEADAPIDIDSPLGQVIRHEQANEQAIDQLLKEHSAEAPLD